MRVVLKRTGIGVCSSSGKSSLCGTVGVRSDVPLPLHMQAPVFPLVIGFVDDALRNTVPSVNKPLLQLVNVVFRFCVMSGSAET